MEVWINAGSAAGNTAPSRICQRRAPRLVSASWGPRSQSSIAPAKKRPANPTVSTIIARIPAIAPGPRQATKTIAHTNSGIVRSNASPLCTTNDIPVVSEWLREASTLSGILSTIPKPVPASAIWVVTPSERTIAGNREKSGGIICPARRLMRGRPRIRLSIVNPEDARQRTTVTESAMTASPFRRLSAVQRGGVDQVGGLGFMRTPRAAVLLRTRPVDVRRSSSWWAHPGRCPHFEVRSRGP